MRLFTKVISSCSSLPLRYSPLCLTVGNFYNFTNAGAGAYTFNPSNIFQAVEADGSLTVIEAGVSDASTELSGQLASSKFISPESAGGVSFAAASSHSKRATYRSNCSSSRQTTNNQALTASATLARNAISHLNSNPSGSTLQTTWYGTFASSRYSATLKSFNVSWSPCCYPRHNADALLYIDTRYRPIWLDIRLLLHGDPDLRLRLSQHLWCRLPLWFVLERRHHRLWISS